MSRLLALDYGSKRVGVAISDKNQPIALPRPIIYYKNTDELIDVLKNICKQENIDKIIIGLPLNLAGQDTEQTKQTRQFAELIINKLKLPIVLEDERYTTKIVADLRSQETKKKYRQQKEYDSQAATVLLQGYLDKGELGYRC